MSFIKRYWFGCLTGFILSCFLVLFILLIISPKQDTKGRGFIKCTQEMVNELTLCNKKIWCSIKAIGNNTLCDVFVVAKGFDLWLDDKQPTPWSNYIFEPELEENLFFDEEARIEYIKNNPDTKDEMIRLNKLRKDLENEANKNLDITEEMLPKEIVQDEKGAR